MNRNDHDAPLQPLRLLLASSNPHKLVEIEHVWATEREQHQTDDAAHDARWLTLRQIEAKSGPIEEPVEDGRTFEDNALIKARYYARRTGIVCVADDSGLEVDALDGAPGVISARYAGMSGPRADVDAANNRKLLDALGDTPADQRAARFICVMAVCHPGRGEPLTVVRGVFEGRIIGPGESPRGDNGFGYDPLFFLPEQGCTSAELRPEEKNLISHRGQAARQLWAELPELHQAIASIGA